MDKRDRFWEDIREYYPQIITAITDLSSRSYISVTDLQNRRTWWSKNALEFFDIDENYTAVGQEKVNVTVHPSEKEYYKKAFVDRMKGIDVDIPVDYRIQTRSSHYDRFTAQCKMIKDAQGQNRFLLVHYDNHGIADTVDSVTGLHTLATFKADLQYYIENRIPETFLKIGIDQFSRMNVLYGAEYSDAILNSVSQILIDMKPKRSYVYRLSGAKFVIAIGEISYEELRLLYGRIVDALAGDIVVAGSKVPLKVSGGAVRLENQTDDANEIRSRLTYSLNHSRYAHHGELVIFNEEFSGSNEKNIDIISVIHQSAVKDFDGFKLFYQPIVESATNEIKGMEALLRWEKAPYGVIPPGVFIEWLEEDACIYELGNWIIRTALKDCKAMAENRPGFFVNINVCPAQLERKEFRENLLRMLEESGLQPAQMCIELTERCRNLDVGFLRKEVEFFKENGIKVALDDFGTGTSSLAVVLQLPFDEVKIDTSFIKGLTEKPLNQAMIKSIIDFAREMKLEICVEGVEDKTLRDHLLSYGAKWFQGYYYSKPVPIEEFKKLM